MARAAYNRLDMPYTLTPETTIPLLSQTDARLQQAAFWVIAHHPDWAAAMRGIFEQWLAKGDRDEKQNGQLRRQLLAFVRDESIQNLVARRLQDPNTSTASRLLLLETIGQAPLQRLPEVWARELRSSLADADERIVRQAVAALRSVPLPRRLVTKPVDANTSPLSKPIRRKWPRPPNRS